MPNETDCQVMAEVATSSFLRTSLGMTTLLCILCVPCTIYSFLAIQKATKLHFNSKCIFHTLTIFAFIHMIVRIILHGKDLLNYVGPWMSGCEIFPSRSRCELRKLYKISAFVVEVTPFVLTAERFVATFRARHYENRYKWCGVLLNIFHISLALFLFTIQSSEKVGGDIIYYCWMSSTGNRYMLNLPIFVIVFSQLITIPALLYLLRKNEKFREASLQKRSTLSQRYQLSQNLQTLTKFRIVSTVTWIYVTYNAAATFGVHFFLKSMSSAGQFAIIEIVHCLPLYYLILIFLMVKEDKKPHRQFSIKVDHYEPQYFNDLQKFFDQSFDKVKKTKSVTFVVS